MDSNFTKEPNVTYINEEFFHLLKTINDLTLSGIHILGRIDTEEKCYRTNNWFCNFYDMSISTVKKQLKVLKDNNLIQSTGNNRNRCLELTEDFKKKLNYDS